MLITVFIPDSLVIMKIYTYWNVQMKLCNIKTTVFVCSLDFVVCSLSSLSLLFSSTGLLSWIANQRNLSHQLHDADSTRSIGQKCPQHGPTSADAAEHTLKLSWQMLNDGLAFSTGWQSNWCVTASCHFLLSCNLVKSAVRGGSLSFRWKSKRSEFKSCKSDWCVWKT